MRFILCLTFFSLIIVIGAFTGEQIQKLNQINSQCFSEVGLSPFRPDETLKKKFILCTSKGMGLMKENGEIDREVVRRRVQKAAGNGEEAKRVVGKCVVNKNTPEDTAMDLVSCLAKEAPANFSIID